MILTGDLGKISPEQENFIRLTYKSCQAIIQIIDDLITGMEVEEGRVTLKKLETQIEELVDSVINEIKPIVTIKNIDLQFKKPSPSLPLIEVDPVKIRQVISKLVDNAVKYTEEGGKVIIELKKEKNHLLFSVKDTGIGIPKNEKEKIFEKFYRASNATRTQQNASGLGLFVARAFIEAHGGKIWFESAEGRGTTFYFSLPIK